LKECPSPVHLILTSLGHSLVESTRFYQVHHTISFYSVGRQLNGFV